MVVNRSSIDRLRVVLAAVTVLALLAVGCGSDGEGSSASASDAGPVPASADDDAPAEDAEDVDNGSDEADEEASDAPEASDDGGETTAADTNEPVRVMVILDESDAMGLTYTTKRAAMEATASDIATSDGLGGSGRPVELEYCVTQFDPNLAQQCAREAVDDESIVAVVGMITNYPDLVNPILEEAGMASVGTEPYGLADGTSPISFPVSAGYLSSVAGMGTILADVAGATQISVVHADVPSAQASVGTIRRALEPRGLELVNTIAIPIGKADVSAETAAALENSDGLALLTDPATASNVIVAMNQQGNVVPIGASSGQFSAESLEALGEQGDGMLLANWFATDDQDVPGVKEFLRIMETYDTLDHSDDAAKSGYTAMLLLDQAAQGLETIDRAGLLANLQVMDSFDTGGLAPVIDFTQPGPLVVDGTDLPRFVNPMVTYGRVQDATLVTIDGTFIDPFEAP